MSRVRFSPKGALLAIVLVFSAVMVAFFRPVFPYNDTDGLAFLRTARDLALHADPAQRTADPWEFVGEQMVEAREGVFYSKYPSGYPLLCAVAYFIGGPAAPFAVNRLLAVVGLLGIYLLAGTLTQSRAMGAWAAAMLASTPVYIAFATSPLSHTASLCTATFGMWFLWRWSSNGGVGNAALAGALIAFGSSIRYPDALLVLPIGVLVVWRYRNTPAGACSGREVLAIIVGGFIALMPQLAYQAVAFGSPWVNGYAFSSESTAFSWAWFVEHAPMVFHHVLDAGLMPLCVLAMIGIAYLAVVDRRCALLLLTWIVPLSLLYCGYYFIRAESHIASLRYFLVVLPAVIVAALIPLAALGRPRLTYPLLAILCVQPMLSGFPVWQAVSLRKSTPVPNPTAVQVTDPKSVPIFSPEFAPTADPMSDTLVLSEQLRLHVPDDSVVLSSDHVLHFLDYEGRYTLYDVSILSRRYRTWAQNILATEGPTPYQRARLRKLVDRLGDQDFRATDAIQREIVLGHLDQGHPVVLLSVSPVSKVLRPFRDLEFPRQDAEEVALRPFQGEVRAVKIAVFPLGLSEESTPRTVTLYALEYAPLPLPSDQSPAAFRSPSVGR